MKVTCSKADLANGMNIALRAVAAKSTMPIFECVLLEAINGVLGLTATDQEIGVETVVDCDVQVPGSVAVDAKLFAEIVRKMPNADVTITTDEKDSIKITCGKSKFNIPGRSSEDFVTLPTIKDGTEFSMPQVVLRDMIRQTIFSVAQNDTKRMMMGELFRIKAGNLQVVALDGHRIAIRNTQLDNFPPPDCDTIIPSKALTELSKILSGDASDDVRIFIDKDNVQFDMDTTKFITRTIFGEYFKIDQMLSRDYETKIEVDRSDLYDSVNRATILVREGDKKPLVMKITDESAEISVKTSTGESTEEIEIEKSGADLTIGFNPRFIQDALTAVGDDIVSIYFTNAKAPCLIKDDEGTYTYVILPVNIGSPTA